MPKNVYARDACPGALAAAGLGDGLGIDAAWFGNCLMHLERVGA